MKKHLSIAFLFIAFYTNAQLIDAYQEEIEYQKENTFGINLNTIGGTLGGINYRHSKKLADGDWNTIFVELASIKHSKEISFEAPRGGSISYGKLNYFFALRTQFAREKRLFWKAKEDGVRLTWVYSAGPTFGFAKPYFIVYDYTTADDIVYDQYGNIDLSKTVFDERTEAYDPYSRNKHIDKSRILESGGFFTGFNQTKLHMGISVKTALNFEFGLFERAASGLETGFMFDYFFKEVELYELPSQPTKLFSSIYLTFYFGNRKK